MMISLGKYLILNFQQFYFFAVIHCIAQIYTKLYALVACCFKMCADFFLNTKFSVSFLKTWYFGTPLKSTLDPERRPLEIPFSISDKKI